METLPVKSPGIGLNRKTKETVVFIICLTCIFLFLSSAYSKLAEHQRFEHGLQNVDFISSFAPFLSWVVPILEIVIALLLIIPPTFRYGLYSFTALMSLFTFYIGGMMLWADKLPCHCNLFIEKLSWRQHLLFNIAFILMALFALRLSKKFKKS
ncbi:MauE/DoxX family redox-associated membrane protein [Flavobacterium sp.]|uniref:MauE/DoxX family redox-associated membrane protein n=1 Tax=Flavobacterium sp. TaxID=239 RepID=UPI003A913F1D